MPAATRIGRVRARSGGAAIVTVLLVVTLVSVIVSGLFWRQHVTVRSVENRLALAQARWIERAALDWARVILRDDIRRGNVDHLGEPWAVPVAETRLDETVTGGASIGTSSEEAFLAGRILDAQGLFNINNLAPGGVPSEDEYEAFRRLLELLGQPRGLA
ncbi:MAG: type II secretion system minor pseudopilin GspK, partial [Burkholderiales bacterium]